MPRRPPLTVLAVALLAGTACTSSPPAAAPPATGPVDVPVPASAAPAGCARLAPLLPPSLGAGLDRRPVTGDAGRTAAWGDPAVTLTCGTRPAAADAEVVRLAPPGERPLTFAYDDEGAINAFTADGLSTPVTVRVPDAYDATVLVGLVTPLRQALPRS